MIVTSVRGVGDAAKLAGLHRQGFEAPWSAAEIAALLESPGVFAFGADIAGRPAAFILCRIASDEAEVLTIATGHDHRRMGLAGRLLDTALAAALAHGAATMFLEVAIDNVAARGLYDGRGFRVVGRRPRYYARAAGAPADALIMRRDLNR